MEEKGHPSLIGTVARILVQQRRAVLAIFALICLLCAYTSTLVKTIDQLEHFLPADTETRIGLDLMDQEFVTYDTAQVVISNISLSRAETLAEELRGIEHVKEVDFSDAEDHYHYLAALFDITFTGANDAPESREALAAVQELLGGYDLAINTEVGDPLKTIINSEMLIVDAIAFIIIVLVLLLTSNTYGEILVLLLTFGAAALMNMGTNFLMGEISFVTDSIAVVLQLALAIDYAIILCHRFTEERDQGRGAEEAAISALTKAIPQISGSSLTTVSGLFALTFMQYRLGSDMGFVMIKAVLLSLVAVFCLMPGLLVVFSGLMDRTHHKKFLRDMPFLGRFAYRTRRFVPFIFLVVLIAACVCSNKASYVYDQYSVSSIRKNEIQRAKEKIQETFGTPNTFAVIIPAGNNEDEKAIVAEIKRLKHTLSVTGLADIDAVDGYKLLDDITPRQFAELADIDIEVAELAFSSYALEHSEYGLALTGMDNYTVPLLDIVDYLLDNRDNVSLNLDAETQDKLNEMQDKLNDGKLQLLSDSWSRIVVKSDLPSEGKESYNYLNVLRGIAGKYYSTSYVVGTTTSCSDLQQSFENDNVVITILTIIFVTLILVFTFRSAGLPLLLIMVIQGSIFLNFTTPYLFGHDLFFLTYLIISAIQMGANIDYAIVISDRYLDARKTLEPREAMTDALNKASPTVITSGTMMSAAGFAIAFIASNETISAIGVYLGKGTLISMFLVAFVLPQILLWGDGFIQKTSFGKTREHPTVRGSGKIRLEGHVKGYVNGYINAQIQGTFRGEIDASVAVRSAPPMLEAQEGEDPHA